MRRRAKYNGKEMCSSKAIYAAGVQFPPVHLDGQTFLPGQANNF